MATFVQPAPGSVAIVTGASAGLGRELARQLARRGHVVLAVARRADRLAELAAEVNAAGTAVVAGSPSTGTAESASAGMTAGRIETLALDVTAAGATERIRETARRLGEIGWLVNNAGGSTFGRFETANVEEQVGLVRLNCEAVVALTGAVLPDLVRAGRGIVLQVASSAGMQPTPGWAVYGASKAFVIAFSEGLYDELRGSGVSVTALCPGPVDTEFFAANAAGASRKAPPWEISARDCAARGIAAALAGRALLVTGWTTWLLTFAGRFSPRAAARWVSGRIGLRYIGLPPLPPRGR